MTHARPGRRLLLLASLTVPGLVALAACGTQQQLQPKAGHRLPVGPRGQDTPQSADQLLEPEAAQRPNRSEELLKRSEPRKPDPFDLPPS